MDVYPTVLVRPVCGGCGKPMALSRSTGKYKSFVCLNSIHGGHGCRNKGNKAAGANDPTVGLWEFLNTDRCTMLGKAQAAGCVTAVGACGARRSVRRRPPDRDIARIETAIEQGALVRVARIGLVAARVDGHLVDHVIPPVPVRQRVISVPKRLRCFLADRPNAVAALTRIFIEEIERLLCTAAGPTRAGDRPSAARPRLGVVSFLHRFGSTLNHHVHLHACVTDGVFVPKCDGPPAFLPVTASEKGGFKAGLRRRDKSGLERG